MPCKVGTIGQIHKRLIENGYFISQYALRQWVKDGKLPVVRSGKKIFITYDHVVELLTTGTVMLGSAAAASV